MTAAGSPEKVKSALGIIKTAVIGLIIVLSSYAIANFVVGSLVNETGVENVHTAEDLPPPPNTCTTIDLGSCPVYEDPLPIASCTMPGGVYTRTE
jgi:hypothetical protein